MRGIYTPGSTFVATDASDRLLRYARDFTSSLQNSIKFESGLLIIDLYQYISDFQLRYSVFGLDPKKFGESCLKGSESLSILDSFLFITMYASADEVLQSITPSQDQFREQSQPAHPLRRIFGLTM